MKLSEFAKLDLVVETIDYSNFSRYRLYEASKPNNTIAYYDETDISNVIKDISNNYLDGEINSISINIKF